MVQNPGNLSKQRTNKLGPVRKLNVQQLLHTQSKALLVCHHGHIVQTVKVGQSLHVRLVLDQLLRAPVQQPNVRIRTHNLFTVELQNQPQHTVSCRVLGTKVDRVMANLAADPFRLRLQPGRILCVRHTLFVREMCEAGIRRDQPRGLITRRLGLTTRRGRGYRPASGDSSSAAVSVQRRGAKPFGRIARQASKRSSHSCSKRGERPQKSWRWGGRQSVLVLGGIDGVLMLLKLRWGSFGTSRVAYGHHAASGWPLGSLYRTRSDPATAFSAGQTALAVTV